MRRNHIVIALLVFLAVLLIILWQDGSSPALNSPLSLAVQAADPDCIVWGEDAATGSLEIRCKTPDALSLFVDLEIRTPDGAVETKTVETEVYASAVPTSAISLTVEISDMLALGELWVRARWATGLYESGVNWRVQRGGEVLPVGADGFALYQELFQGHLPIILMVVE